jgi:hypothetical protein
VLFALTYPICFHQKLIQFDENKNNGQRRICFCSFYGFSLYSREGGGSGKSSVCVKQGNHGMCV